MAINVNGQCPMGCGETLLLDNGMVFCGNVECPRPYAPSEILEDTETEHLVWLDATGFTVRHPLKERLDRALHDCVVHQYLEKQTTPREPGLYRIKRDERSRWRWESLSDEPPIRSGVDQLLESAWGIIANAGEGSWDREHPDWKDAAVKWREDYFAYLDTRD